MPSTLSFFEFLRMNAPANLAIVFLVGVFVGMFIWQWSKKFFFILIILAVLLAGAKVHGLAQRWPFSFLNRDAISAQIKKQSEQYAKDQAKQEIHNATAP